MMFTATDNEEDQISFMDPYYPSLLSPYSCFEIDGYYYNNLSYDNHCHDESVLMSFSGGGNTIAESSNNNNDNNSNHEPIISASSKMDATYQGDIINGIVEQDHNNKKSNGSKRKVQISCKKRSSKGDRHSKIPTAKGLRDRRMRLSLEVARQFFRLQDMLNYDKPSQTVKWLLLQAKSTIEELKEGNQIHNDGVKSASPNSEIGEEVVEDVTIHDKVTVACETAPKGKEKVKHATKKKAFNHKAKELRKRARERAKERTEMKKASVMSLNYMIEQQIEANPEDNGVLDANWSHPMILNYHHHQEDQTYQMKSVQEVHFEGGSWNPYNYAQF